MAEELGEPVTGAKPRRPLLLRTARAAWRFGERRLLPSVEVFSPVRGSLLSLLPRRKAPVAVRWGASPHTVWVRPGTTDLLTFRQILLGGEYDFAVPMPEPEVIVDVGANIGLSAVWFATRFPSARILCIEPDPDNFAVLELNIAPYPRVSAERAALWSSRSTLRLVDPLNEGGWSMQTREAYGTRGPGRELVQGITMRDLFDRFGLERVSLLKVDIEGAEQKVFSDPDLHCWLDRVQAIAIELHDRFRPGCAETFFSAVHEDFAVRYLSDNTLLLSRRDSVGLSTAQTTS